MARLIPLLIVALLLYLALRKYQALPPAQKKKWAWQSGVAIFLVLILAALLTGKMNWIGALIMGSLPFLKNAWVFFVRGLALFGWWKKMRPQARAKNAYIVLHPGAGDGDILQGIHAGRKLSELGADELDTLLREVLKTDPPAAELLQLYLINRFGQAWQGAPLDHVVTQGEMNSMEARALLGVNEGASRKDIISAHRKLIQKFHPDRGGNDYLAARINAAKDLLLKQAPRDED